MTLSRMTLSRMTLNRMTLSRMTLSGVAPSRMSLHMFSKSSSGFIKMSARHEEEHMKIDIMISFKISAKLLEDEAR